MSNIFDALNKQRHEVRDSAEPVVPLLTPRPPDLPPAPAVGDPARDLELERLRQNWAFELDIRDVDSDPAWRRAHGEKVPLLLAGDREISRYFLDLEQLRRYLDVD